MLAEALYIPIKHLHLTLALTSGAFFLLRSVSSLSGQDWPHWPRVRRCSAALDSALLLAALALVYIVPNGFFANGWLWSKLACLFLYIGFGVLAMRARFPIAIRGAALLVAVLMFIQIYFIARTHDPLGALVYF